MASHAVSPITAAAQVNENIHKTRYGACRRTLSRGAGSKTPMMMQITAMIAVRNSKLIMGYRAFGVFLEICGSVSWIALPGGGKGEDVLLLWIMAGAESLIGSADVAVKGTDNCTANESNAPFSCPSLFRHRVHSCPCYEPTDDGLAAVLVVLDQVEAALGLPTRSRGCALVARSVLPVLTQISTVVRGTHTPC